jgi:hypothetical protein
LLYDISEGKHKRRVNLLYDWYEAIPDDVLEKSLENVVIMLAKEINNCYIRENGLLIKSNK